MVKQAASAGLSDEEIADLCGFSNPRRVPVVKRNAKIYTTEDLKEIIIELSNIDKKAKSGYNGIYELKKFLLNL
jgi:DNA polymerase III delta subunit